MRLREFDYSSPFTYFITLCTKGKAEYFKNNSLCEEVIGCLIQEKREHGFSIYAYCLMPNHLHMLLSPNQSGKSVSRFIGSVKSQTTRIAWKQDLKEKLWQGSFYDHVLRKDEDVRQTAEYILNNPVRKGLVSG
jgi:REP element-mobilizing transposase RayT